MRQISQFALFPFTSSGMILAVVLTLVMVASAEIASVYSTGTRKYLPSRYSRTSDVSLYSSKEERRRLKQAIRSMNPCARMEKNGHHCGTTAKPYSLTEEVDGLVKYYTDLAFPSTAQRNEHPVTLPSRSPYRFEKKSPPRRTPSPQPSPQFSLDYLPEKGPEYLEKLPFRGTYSRAFGIAQYVQPPRMQQYAPQPAASPGYAAAAAYPCYAAVHCTTTTTEPPETTTTVMTTTTTNGYNVLGWQTDDDGNVFVGDDNAKLLLIQASSSLMLSFLFRMPSKKYWDPLPKDWPEADWFGSMFPDSKNYRGPVGACPKC